MTFEDMGIVKAPPALKVLVIEDLEPVAWRLERRMRELGHAATVMEGVDEVREGLARGPAFGERLECRLDGFDAAFVDYYFASRTLDGGLLVPELVRAGVRTIVGMSSENGKNDAMVRAGAHFAVLKRIVRSL